MRRILKQGLLVSMDSIKKGMYKKKGMENVITLLVECK